MADKEEKLLGDITSDVLRTLRLDRVSNVYSRITKKPCNCAERKAKLNHLHQKWRENQTRNQERRNQEILKQDEDRSNKNG
jgi:hypothetical protein